jgi:hypothetical protein
VRESEQIAKPLDASRFAKYLSHETFFKTYMSAVLLILHVDVPSIKKLLLQRHWKTYRYTCRFAKDNKRARGYY